MNKQKQMLEILKDTRDYYAADPDNRRSIDKDGSCHYTWGDTHCAIGRYLQSGYQTEDWYENDMSVNELCSSNPIDDSYNIDWCVRDDVKGIDPDFWMALQDFHDSRHNWITTKDSDYVDGFQGLSEDGKVEYNTIKQKITEGRYDG